MVQDWEVSRGLIREEQDGCEQLAWYHHKYGEWVKKLNDGGSNGGTGVPGDLNTRFNRDAIGYPGGIRHQQAKCIAGIVASEQAIRPSHRDRTRQLRGKPMAKKFLFIVSKGFFSVVFQDMHD